MSEGLRRLFRSCLSLVPILIVAGALLANAQTLRMSSEEGSALLVGGERLPGSLHSPTGAPGMVPAHPVLAMQIDTLRPGARDFLEPNAPNPFGLFSATTRMGFSISQPSRVELRIYDFFYNEVVTLIDEDMQPGRYVREFNPPPTMPSGMYFYELKTNSFRDLRRMIYIK